MKTFTNALGREQGFTLIEILIVVAIIAILASMAVVALGPAQRQGRDARRLSDLRQTQSVLELYYQKCGFYPGGAIDASGNCPSSFGSAPSDWPSLSAVLTGSTLGVSKVPDDPTTGKHYHYWSDGTTYVIGADLENTSNAVLKDSIHGTSYNSLTIDCGASTYCISL